MSVSAAGFRLKKSRSGSAWSRQEGNCCACSKQRACTLIRIEMGEVQGIEMGEVQSDPEKRYI